MAKNRRKENTAEQSSGSPTSADYGRDRVATRAYELYLARGAGDGQELDDWLRAERELRDRQSHRPTTT